MSSRSTPSILPRRLPMEVIDTCFHLFAETCSFSKRKKEIGRLGLVCRHVRDLFIGELFKYVSFRGLPDATGRPAAFLNLIEHNKNILKHIRDVSIYFKSNLDKPLQEPVTDHANLALNLLRTLAKASFKSLSIYGLDTHFPHPAIYDALHTLRCGPNLQDFTVSSTSIPPFLVCGHLASTRLKSLSLPHRSAPNRAVEFQVDFVDGLEVEEDSVFASAFQPFAELEQLSVENLADFPQYYPLHDFGSDYYDDNYRFPFTLPRLVDISVGMEEVQHCNSRGPLSPVDYCVLGSLLSRAPNIKSLFIADDFPRPNGIEDFSAVVDELPALENLTGLSFFDRSNATEEHGAIATICKIITASAPPALQTLYIGLVWDMENAAATRAALYCSPGWNELYRLLCTPFCKSLCRLDLYLEIRRSFDPECEAIGHEEVAGLKKTLINFYSLGGKLKVGVQVVVDGEML